jgi:hypothetical protein
MLEQDLRSYRCPQQFIKFKLGLRRAVLLQQSITFNLNRDEAAGDIERFLKKYSYSYNLNIQLGLLLVEPLRV